MHLAAQGVGEVVVPQHLVSPGLPGELLLLAGGDRAVDLGALELGQLDEQLPHAARARVDEDLVALLHLVRGVRQIVGRHALQHRRGRHLGRHAVGHRHRPIGGHHDLLGVAAEHARPRHRVPHGDTLHAWPHGRHRSRALAADDGGQIERVRAGALVDVDEVDATGGDVDHELPLTGYRVGTLDVFENLWTALGGDDDGMHAPSQLRLPRAMPPRGPGFAR